MEPTVAWIRAAAMPLVTVEAGNGFADLEPVRRLIAGARIVSLGEATHGTREFFQLKHRLLEFCVSELGFTIFAIEASFPECLRINDYVLNGTGNAADALAGQRFWTWDTEEVQALIEWMRAWNRTHQRQIKFYGFDMQFPTEAALGVLDYLQRVAPQLAAASEVPLWPLSDDFSADRFHLIPSATRDAAQACVERILDTFARKRSAWVAATSELEWQLARFNAVVLDQSARLRLAVSRTAPTISRDIAMAENVAALLELEGPRARAVLWAHNGHAARETKYLADDETPMPNMGSRLHEMFGREHLIIGFAFNQGSFQAIEWGRGLVNHTVTAAPEGSLDCVLAAAGMPAFLLDLATAPAAGPVHDWLESRPLSRCIGSVYSAERAETYLDAADPRHAYDVLAFIETTAAARPTEAGRRSRPANRRLARAATNLQLGGVGELPEGWERSGSRGGAHAHRVALAEERSPAGARTVRIARVSAPWRWGEGRLEQKFSAEAWCGKRLRFSGAVRAEVRGPGAGAQLYIEVRPKPPEGVAWIMPAAAMGMVDRPVRSPHWARYGVEVDVPDEAHSINIGLALAGNGAGWFGDLELESG